MGYWTFVPNPLPPNIDYDKALIRLLSEADRLLGELSGTGRLLPNPYLLISPYIRREAVLSSRIEGTKKVPESAYRLINEIFMNPVISISALSRKWNISFNSVKTGVTRLLEIGILREISIRKRNKLFIAPELMELLTTTDK